MNHSGYFDQKRTDYALIEASIARSAGIIRSEHFKIRYRQWLAGPHLHQVLHTLRHRYGQTFLTDAPTGCLVAQEELHCQVVFNNLPSADSLRHYFLLDYFKEKAHGLGFVSAHSFAHKYVVPEMGITVLQRYRFRRKMNWLQKMRSWVKLPSYGLMLQLKLHSERSPELLIRYDHALAAQTGIRLEKLMELLLDGPQAATRQTNNLQTA